MKIVKTLRLYLVIVFVFIFKILFLRIKKKTIFLYFLNQKHVWLVEIKKKKSLLKKKKLKYVVIRV